MASEPDHCTLCGEKGVSTTKIRSGGRFERVLKTDCSACGIFYADIDELADFVEEDGRRKASPEFSFRLSVLCREQNLATLSPYYLRFGKERGDEDYFPVPGTYSVNAQDLVKDRWPRNVPETLDRALIRTSFITASG